MEAINRGMVSDDNHPQLQLVFDVGLVIGGHELIIAKSVNKTVKLY